MDEAFLNQDVLAGVCRAAWAGGDIRTYTRLTYLLSKDASRCLCSALSADFHEARTCRRQFSLCHMCDVARHANLDDFAANSLTFRVFNDLRQGATFDYLLRHSDIFYSAGSGGSIPLHALLELCRYFTPALRVVVVHSSPELDAHSELFAKGVALCHPDDHGAPLVDTDVDLVISCGVVPNSLDLSFEELAYRECTRGKSIWLNIFLHEPWATYVVSNRANSARTYFSV